MCGLSTKKPNKSLGRVIDSSGTQRISHPAGSLLHFRNLVGTAHLGVSSGWLCRCVPHLETENSFRVRNTLC